MGGLAASGFTLPLLFATQTVGGALLLARRFVALALILLAPIIVNIVLFHFFIDPAGIPRALFVLMLEVFLAWAYRASFRPVLHARDEVTIETSRTELRPRAG